MARHPKLILFASAAVALVGTACQLPPFLPEFQISTSDPGHNSAEDVAMSDQGDFVVTWGEFNLDSEVFGRRFAASTSPFGGPFPVNANTTPSRKTPSIARDAEGRFVIVWSEDDTGIWGQRFASDGTPLGDNFQISLSTTGYVAKPHVASDPSGNFVVTWTSYPPGIGSSEAVARRYDSHGAPFADEFPVSVYTTGFQYPSGIAMSPAGFVVTWFGEGQYGNAVFGRRFDASGAPITGDFQVWFTGVYGLDVRPDVGMNAAGDFVVVWDERIGLSFPAMGRRYNSNGEPAGDVFPISDTSLVAYEARVASDSAGNFVVTWSNSSLAVGGSGTGGTGDIRARLYDIGGVAVSEEFVVNEITTGLQSRGRPSLADDGSFVVAFNDGVVFDADVKGRKSGARAAPAITVDPSLEVPSAPSGSSNANGVFEPGETVLLHTAWVNDTAADVLAVVGSSPFFTGPAGADYTIDNDGALYDTLPAGQTKSCAESGGECFIVTVSDPAARPVQHWDARLQETLTLSLAHTWVLHLGESFPDVPTDNQFYRFIETLFHNGVTGGCVGGYCPGDPVTRAQMAVFLLKAKSGSAHVPPPCTGTVFTDVPCTGSPFDSWIEELASLQITGGCGNGNYCPNNTVTRQQMAVFLLKAFEGSTYVPPACTGIFDDVTCTPGTGFPDWIEELYNRGITGGCSMAPLLYCPTNPNNRGQMAVFLVKTFGLVLYGG